MLRRRSFPRLLQTPDVFQSMLVKDRGEIRFRDVIHKRGISKDNGGFTSGSLFFMPGDDSQRNRFGVFACNRFVETDNQDTAADAVDGFTSDFPLDDRNRQIQPQFQQKFEQDIQLGAVLLEVLRMFFQTGSEVRSVRVPRSDIAAIQLEHTKPKVAPSRPPPRD